MSTAIYYQPVKPCRLNVDYPGAALTFLQQEFGKLPIEVDSKDIDALHRLGESLPDSLWQDIVHAICEHGTVRVWAEY